VSGDGPTPIERLEGRPLPELDNVSRTYWDGLARGVLLLQRCRSCARYQFFPRALCVWCGGDPEWVESSGRGVVHTYTVIRQNRTPPFHLAVPYVVAMIELEGGVRVLGNVTGCPPEDVFIGLPVRLETTDAGAGVYLPHWRP
jgi:uncharacterized protein